MQKLTILLVFFMLMFWSIRTGDWVGIIGVLVGFLVLYTMAEEQE